MAEATTDTILPRDFTIEIGDQKFTCSPATMDDRLALREHIRQKRIDAVKAAFQSMSAEVLASAVAKTSAQPIHEAEVYEIMTGEEGQSFMLWRGIRRNHPQVQLAWLRDKLGASLIGIYATQQYTASGYLVGGDDDNPHKIQLAPDYDREIATILKFYGGAISLADAANLTLAQLRRLEALIPAVRETLGEVKP